MSGVSIDESLKRIEYIFRWTGMNLDSSKKSASENRKYKILFIFTTLWINSDVAGAISWFINGARKGKSLTSLTYVAPCITLTMLSNLKSIFFVINESQVNELIAILRNVERKNIQPSKEKNEVVKQETEFLHLILKILNFFNWGLIVSFPVMCLLPILWKYYKTNKFVPALPLLIEYPFDEFNLKIWPFVFMRQIYSTAIVVLDICGADYVFYICSTYINMHFKILRHDFESLIQNQAISEGIISEKFELKERFSNLICTHHQLIRCVHLLEVIYSKSTMFNFVSSSALICLTGFNVTTVDDTSFVISFLSFLFTSLLQIFFLCFFGDMLMNSSIEVGAGVYKSRWYLTNPCIGKKINFVQMRAQKACKLTAYGFAEVNLAAFTKVLSTAWSYFALLKTMYGRPQ